MILWSLGPVVPTIINDNRSVPVQRLLGSKPWLFHWLFRWVYRCERGANDNSRSA